MNTQTSKLSSPLIQTLQARAETSPALARAASLPGFSISSVVRANEAEIESPSGGRRVQASVTTADHLEDAHLLRKVIREKAHSRVFGQR